MRSSTLLEVEMEALPSSRSALHRACLQDRQSAKLVQRLIEAAPRLINLKDHNGDTPLHGAVLRSNLSVLKTLLKSGARLDEQDGQGNTVISSI